MTLMNVIREISPKDDMFQGDIDHYFSVGESALKAIQSALAAVGKKPEEILEILDLPCGYGRVLRILKAAFPHANITACDLEKDGVDFCAQTFSAIPVYSTKEISNIPLPGEYDLIWVGSLFTHLDLNSWYKFFDLFSRKLKPGGLLVLSVHGTLVVQNIQGGRAYGLMPEVIPALLKQYQQNEFGFASYFHSADYGISIASPAKVTEIVNDFPALKLVSYMERAWDRHHDVLCCQKREAFQAAGESSDEASMSRGNEKSLPGAVAHPATVPDVRKFEQKHAILPAERLGEDSKVIFCLPEGLTLGGVTTWSVEVSRELNKVGIPTALGIHPSRYNNPPVDFGITEQDHLIDLMHLPHPDEPGLNAADYVPFYSAALPGILIPSWSWGTYAMAAILASQQPEMLRIIGMAHSDESGYYQLLAHYEAMIHKFIVANARIRTKLSRMIPHRKDDIIIKPCPVRISDHLKRTYSPPGKPLQLIYGGRIAQYQKRVFELIDLIKALVDEGVHFNFRIIGGGADKDEFEARVNQLPPEIRALVQLEDSVPLAELTEIWRSTDINVLVSDFEGVSNSMLMGMAEGCVPVMTAVSGTVEVITSGKEGILVPVGDVQRMAKAIKMLDDDRSRLDELGQNARKKIQAGYSMQDYISLFSEVVRQIRAEPPRPWPPVKKPLDYIKVHQEFLRLSELIDNNPDLQKPDQKRKVIFLSHEAVWGGAGKVLYTLVKGLDRERWSAVVILPEDGPLKAEFDKIGIKTAVTPLRYIVAHPRLNRQAYNQFSSDLRARIDPIVDLIDREQADVVVTNTICNFEGALAARQAGVPHIWYVHELTSGDEHLTPPMDYDTFYAAMDALSDRIVVISKAVEHEIEQFFPSKKLALVYTGLENAPAGPVPLRKAILEIDADAPVITFIGNLSERKGVMDLAEAAVYVLRKHPETQFAIVGRTDGPVYPRLQAFLREKKIEDHFKILGFRSNIHYVIANSDLIVVPSRVEPFSLAAIEAMSAGKAVIATRSGGPAEIVVDGETGLLTTANSPYELAQAIIQLVNDSDLRQAMGQNGLRRFNDCFRYEAYVKNFERILDDTIAHPQPKDNDPERSIKMLIDLATIAAQTSSRLARLEQKEDPLKIVDELLTYPGYAPYEIAPCSDAAPRPKVSVCIPVYNGQAYLRKCIDSILAQSFADFELIIVNDASTDRSMEIARSYLDPRTRCVENERNLGLVGNWNRCLELARGEYVCIFHQDDIMAPDNLQKKVEALDAEERVGMVFSDTLIIDQDGNQRADHWFNLIDPNVDFIQPGHAFFDRMFTNLNIVSCPSVMARRACYEQLGGFDMRLPFSVDMEMWMRIALFFDVAYISEALISYRFHESNLTHRFILLDLIHVYLCKRMLMEKFPQHLDASYSAALIEDTSNRVFERAAHHYYIKDYKTARQYLTFLKKIRPVEHGMNPFNEYVDQMLKYVNQTNAVNLLGISQ